MHPRLASSAYTSPLSLATKRRSPSTAGCDRAELTPAKPNAHFSFSFGTLVALRPPLACDWNRVLPTPAPQPFHPASSIDACSGVGDALHLPTIDGGAAVPTGRPARKPATARRSASVSSDPCRNMFPTVSAVRIASGATVLSTSRVGARESAAGFAWHD